MGRVSRLEERASAWGFIFVDFPRNGSRGCTHHTMEAVVLEERFWVRQAHGHLRMQGAVRVCGSAMERALAK